MDAVADSVNVAGIPMQLRDIRQADEQALIALHNLVFETGVNSTWFGWKYIAGQGRGVGLWLNNEMLAFCGGIPRKFCLQNTGHSYLQIGDVMVRPDWRGVLTRHGPFFHVSRSFYSSQIGVDKSFEVGFGFPSARHLRLADHLQLLEQVGEMHELGWHRSASGSVPAPSTRPWGWRCTPFHLDGTDASADVNRCWRQMKADMPDMLVGERDASYLRWRYQQRPEVQHVYFSIKRPWQYQPAGIAVMRYLEDGESVRWLDWIGKPAELPTAAALCWQALQSAGKKTMLLWASSMVADQLRQVANTHQFVTPIGAPRESLLTYTTAGHVPWWFMGGDTDFL